MRIHLNSPAAAKRWADDVAWLKKGADVDGYFVHTDGADVYIGCSVPSDTTAENAEARGLPRDACAVGVFRGAVAFLENNSTIIFACNDPKDGVVYDKSPDFLVRWGDGRDRPRRRRPQENRLHGLSRGQTPFAAGDRPRLRWGMSRGPCQRRIAAILARKVRCEIFAIGY